MSKLTDREKELLRILKTDPMISQDDLAELVGITRSAVAVHISNLIKKGYILGRGYVFNEKTGILVVGSVYLEVQAAVGSDRKDRIEIKNGGPGFEIATHLSIQDIPVSLVSVVGRDNWGEAMTARLKEAGVDTRYIVQTNDQPTPSRVRIVEKGRTTKVVADSEAIMKLEGSALPNIAVALKDAGMVVAEAELPPEVIRQLAELTRNANIRLCVVCVDDIEQKSQEQFNGTFLMVMSVPAARWLSGMEIGDLDTALAAGRNIVEKGIEWVVVVLADEGISIAGRGEGFTLPLLPGHADGEGINLYKLTAGLASGFFKGYELRQNARLSLGQAACLTGKGRNLSEKKEID